MRDQADVVVAGAGPAGVVAALHLAREGVRVALLEAGAEAAQELRATASGPVRRREYLLRQSMCRAVECEREIA